ncbi:ATP synthase subunit s, mitochondrial [Condylostylus longicornis]|uniref:ATP synthase subunit s, mitochondrial n=1 Tax=Condylostylus longicornis TaxID=2530218 RepID=UPI00244E3411|nr:ATP synthase subunit s, mitochondrial [Condylostylus longicornis]
MLLLNNTSQIIKHYKNSTKGLWGYVAIAFNKVDENRLKLVGPNRLCAEWVLKNGGAVSFSVMSNKYIKDYNSLPPENVKFNIIGIDASNSSVMKIGFDHLKGCNHVEKIILHNCKHLEEDGLEGLINVKDILKHLQVSGCYNITESGLSALKVLTKLETLRIFDMKYVQNLEKVTSELKTSLKNCKITTE